MDQKLPADLLQAEDQLFNSLFSNIVKNQSGKISINLKFEGLRLLPLVIRLANRLKSKSIKAILIWPDAGATALAKRDAPDLSENIMSFKDILKDNEINFAEYIIIAVSPQPYDYEEFEKISNNYNGNMIMLNGKLDDAAVGIGSVARERRKIFTSSTLSS